MSVTHETVLKAIGEVYRLHVTGIGSVVKYWGAPAGTLPCAVIAPGRRSVVMRDGSLNEHTYTIPVYVLAALEGSSTEIGQTLTTLSEATWTGFLAHVGAAGGNVSLWITDLDTGMVEYNGKRYAALIVRHRAEDHRAETPELGSVLV